MAHRLRLFLLDGQVNAGSVYLHDGKPEYVELSASGLDAPARTFAADIVKRCAGTLPDPTVLDVAVDAAWRFWVVEAKAASGSGLYASDPVGALEYVLASTNAAQAVDLPAQFVRARAEVDFA